MRTVICGMGEVGRHLARELAESGHDVVAVDTSHESLRDVEASLDVLTLRGHAALPKTLEKAGVERAELVAAVTDFDETNLVTALAARERGARVTVARLGNRDWFPDRRGWLEGHLGVDLALCPGLLAGAEVVRQTRAATVDHLESFAGYLVEVMVVTVDEDVPAAGSSMDQLDLPARCRVLSVVRSRATQSPEAIPHLQPEDQVVVAGPARSLYSVDRLFRQEAATRGRAVVVGGGDVGSNVAVELSAIMDSVVLADRDQERCEQLAATMRGIQIARGDGTSLAFLDEIDARNVREFVATTGHDEVNLMGTLLAKHLGARQAIALLNRPDYAEVYEALGIDSTVSPRLLVSAGILRFLHRRRGVYESRIPADDSVVLELEVRADDGLEGKRLFDLDLGHGVVAVAVARGAALLDAPELVALRQGDVCVIYVPERAITGARRALRRRKR